MKLCVFNIVGIRDEQPNLEHELTRDNHRRYAEKIGAHYRIEVLDVREEPQCCWWKFRASDVAAEYDLTLLLDNDCIVTRKCPSFHDAVPLGHWGVVDELPRLRKEAIIFVADRAGSKPEQLGIYVNGGVLIMPPDAKSVYYPDFQSTPLNWWTDQTLLSYKLHAGLATYRRLDRRWNWSYMSHVDFLSGRDHAYIIHHAGRNNFESTKRKNMAIARDVKDVGI